MSEHQKLIELLEQLVPPDGDPNPHNVMRLIDRDAYQLDVFTKAVHAATEEVDQAEAEWDDIYDRTMADLEEEFGQAGRKSVPEHTAISAARRQNRDAWQRLQRAKRRLAKQQMQLKAKSAAINGRQSELGALREELRAGVGA